MRHRLLRKVIMMSGGIFAIKSSATYKADVGTGATIDDLANNAFTVDGWFKVPLTGANQHLTSKGNQTNAGWFLLADTSGYLSSRVYCATTNATSVSTNIIADNQWHYIKMTFDDAGDRKIDLFIDNVEVAYGTQTAGVDAIVTDAALNGQIGRATLSNTGYHGWVRWSNIIRGAGLIARASPPTIDVNTILQLNVTEGNGATLNDSSGNANHGTMSGIYNWAKI